MTEASESLRAHEVASGPATTSLLFLRAGAAVLAVGALDVREVLDLVDPEPIPLAPSHILGLLALRGEPVPLLDLPTFLQLPEPVNDGPAEPMLSVVLVKKEGMLVGLCCQRVLGVEEVLVEDLMPPKLSVSPAIAPYVVAELAYRHGLAAQLDLVRLLMAARLGA